MKKQYENDTGGRYLIYASAVGYFADVQTVAQAEDAARLWWALTADCDAVIIRERDGEIEKIMRRNAEEEIKMYDYETAVREDVQDAIEENYTEEEIIQHLAEDRDEWQDKLYDDLWVDDAVTGNASGSYTFNSYKAGENLVGNFELLSEALAEFGESGADVLGKGKEWCDVTIRCYLLGGALDSVLDEYEEKYAAEIAAYQE